MDKNEREFLQEVQRHIGIVFEAFNEKLQLVGENVESSREQLERKMMEGFQYLGERIDLTQQALKAVKDELKGDILKLEKKIDGVAAQTQENSTTIARIEVRMDQMGNRLELHDRDIAELKRKTA